MAKISIIIPVYNVKDYLSECLDSLINQTFKDFEIICVDDGSTDSSFDILKAYAKKDSRIIVLQQENKGAGSARNLGIEYLKNKGLLDGYIQFLDADDYFEPNMLEELYNTAVKHNSDLVVCSYERIKADGELVQNTETSPIDFTRIQPEKVFSYKDFPDDIFGLFNVAVWNKLYSADLVFDNNLYFQNLTSCNDVYFGYMSRIYAKRIVVIDKSLLKYKVNRVGSISINRAKYAINILKAMKKIKDSLVEKNLYQLLKSTFIVVCKKHLRWQLSKCSIDFRKEFFEELKQELYDEYNVFLQDFPEVFVTYKYFLSFIKDKKVVLWGASLFIKNLLENQNKKHAQILGIVDRNQSVHGQKIGEYSIYSPEELDKLEPDAVLLTVSSSNKIIYPELKTYLKENNPNIELLPNMFDLTERI